MLATTTHLTHHHRTGVNTGTNRQLYVVVCFQAAIERAHCDRELKPAVDGLLRIVIVRDGKALINNRPVRVSADKHRRAR